MCYYIWIQPYTLNVPFGVSDFQSKIGVNSSPYINIVALKSTSQHGLARVEPGNATSEDVFAFTWLSG